VHDVFRDAFDAAPVLVASGADLDRADTVATYYDVVLRLLRAHHEGEDELLIPLLTMRCRGNDLATVTRVAAQHGPVTELIGTARDRVTDWRRTPGSVSAADVCSALGALQRELVPHLDEEERAVLPIAARTVTPQEWGQMPGHALGQFDGGDLWLVLGLVFDHMSDGQRTVAQAHMPPPLMSAWTENGRAHYAAFAARLHG
jgi:hypothetical protein